MTAAVLSERDREGRAGAEERAGQSKRAFLSVGHAEVLGSSI